MVQLLQMMVKYIATILNDYAVTPKQVLLLSIIKK